MNRTVTVPLKRRTLPLVLGASALLLVSNTARGLRALPAQTLRSDSTIISLPQRREQPVYSLKELANLLSNAERREVSVVSCSECRYLLIALPDGEKTIRASDLRLAMETATGMRWQTVGTKEVLTYRDPAARQEAVRQAYARLSATKHAIYDKVAEHLDAAWPVSWDDINQGSQTWTRLTPQQQQTYTSIAAQSPEFKLKGMAALLSEKAEAEQPSVWFTIDMVYRVRHAGGFLISTSQRIAN